MILPNEIPSIKEENCKIKKEEDFLEIGDEFIDINYITPTIEYDEALNDISIIYEDFEQQFMYPLKNLEIKEEKIEIDTMEKSYEEETFMEKSNEEAFMEKSNEEAFMEKSNEEECILQRHKVKVSVYKEGLTVKNINSCLYQISPRTTRKRRYSFRTSIRTRSQSKLEAKKHPKPRTSSRKLKSVYKRKNDHVPRNVPKEKKKRCVELLSRNEVNLIKGNRSYSCSACGYIGKQRTQVEVHIRRHLNIKPFACDHCDYASVERSHLSRHLKVHFFEKPHKCPKCSYSCIQKSSLRKHLLKCKNF